MSFFGFRLGILLVSLFFNPNTYAGNALSVPNEIAINQKQIEVLRKSGSHQGEIELLQKYQEVLEALQFEYLSSALVVGEDVIDSDIKDILLGAIHSVDQILGKTTSPISLFNLVEFIEETKPHWTAQAIDGAFSTQTFYIENSNKLVTPVTLDVDDHGVVYLSFPNKLLGRGMTKEYCESLVYREWLRAARGCLINRNPSSLIHFNNEVLILDKIKRKLKALAPELQVGAPQTYYVNQGIIVSPRADSDLFELMEKIKKGKQIRWKTRLQMAWQLSRGLEFLHQDVGVQHCDLKPENILVFEEPGPDKSKPNYTVRFTDFDLACRPKKLAKDGEKFEARGNFQYRAPELFIDKPIAVNTDRQLKSDVFGLAEIVYELVLGKSLPWFDRCLEVDTYGSCMKGELRQFQKNKRKILAEKSTKRRRAFKKLMFAALAQDPDRRIEAGVLNHGIEAILRREYNEVDQIVKLRRKKWFGIKAKAS
jgi:hypothetical protein